MEETRKPTPFEKTLLMRIAYFKSEMHLLLKEIDADIPQLGTQSAKYHRYFYQVLKQRVDKAERAMELLRYLEIKD